MASPGSQAKDRQANATRNSRTGRPGNANRDARGSSGGATGSIASGDPRAVDRIAQTMNNANVETHQLKDWAGAQREYNDRSFGRRALDFLAGPFLNDNAPDFNDPRTFWGGTYHTSTNPLGVAGSLLGGAAFPGGGILGGMIGSAIGPEAYHKSMDPNSPLAHEIASAPGASLAPATGNFGASSQLAQGGQFQNTGNSMGQNGIAHLQNLAQLNQGVSGNPNAPQSIGTTPQGPNYTNILASTQQITPNYGVQLPGYQYRGRATV